MGLPVHQHQHDSATFTLQVKPRLSSSGFHANSIRGCSWGNTVESAVPQDIRHVMKACAVGITQELNNFPAQLPRCSWIEHYA
jgi:hypothetical protein